jgi:hypothetical protein
MNTKEAKKLKRGDRLFWSNPNPGADPESGGLVQDISGDSVQILWDDGKACIIRTDEGLENFWKYVTKENPNG